MFTAQPKRTAWGQTADRVALAAIDKLEFRSDSTEFFTTGDTWQSVIWRDATATLFQDAPPIYFPACARGVYYCLFNTHATRSLDYRVYGRVALSSALSVVAVAQTTLAASTNTGILVLSPGFKAIDVQVLSTAAGQAATWEFNLVVVP